MTTVWRGMDQATIDREYNARASVPSFDAEMQRYQSAAAQARATLRMTRDLVFDPASGCALDWFHGEPGGPVFLWIHGGYWRALSKEDQSGVAPGLVAAGIHVAIMDYSLAPAASLDTIVNEVRTACAWVYRNARLHGADAGRLFAGGSSAGGHLAGMILAEDWQPEHAVPRDVVRGAICLSGLYDLEPIRLSHINAWMNLDEAAVARNSPLRHIPAGAAPPLLASYGGRETSEFKRQTEEYVAAWMAAGHRAQVLPQDKRNHFDIVLGLGDPDDALCRAACAFMLEKG